MTILYERAILCPHPAKLCNRSAVPGFESCPLRATITAQFRLWRGSIAKRPAPAEGWITSMGQSLASPQSVRSQSAAELSQAFGNQQNQQSELRVCAITITA